MTDTLNTNLRYCSGRVQDGWVIYVKHQPEMTNGDVVLELPSDMPEPLVEKIRKAMAHAHRDGRIAVASAAYSAASTLSHLAALEAK